MAYLNFPKNKMYNTQRMVRIIEEVLEEEIFEHAYIRRRWRPSLGAAFTTESESLPLEDILERYKDEYIE